MAKLIKITQEGLDEIKKAFEEALKLTKFSDGRINFSKTFGTVKREATVYFTELAWLKMQTLVREFDKEVAWHGIAYRGEDPEKDEYIIKDILVYPQEVSAATVNTDQEEYQTWLMSHEDDVFNNIRMQGHSHVNMGVTPSTVDSSLYERILDQLDDTMFYIFMIYNKRGDKTYKIYDLAKNVLFETEDVTVKILDDGTGIEKFLQDAKSMVKDKSFATTTTYSGAYSGYYGQTTPTLPEKKEPAKSDEKKEDAKTSTQKTGKRKGKRKKETKGRAYPYYGAMASDDSPYGYDYDGYMGRYSYD